ncbi:MAG TPA: cytochrome c biogenesis protein ResB [Pyrinomonadaceae bacterium]|jgi:cytochrome c biogenesis protein|nr:cytochrome c biogenesis protein ResB [Pyrinomonadaceae bacterium]
MSAIEESKSEISVQKAPAKAASPSVVTRLLNLLSSVRFGVTLLVLLVIASMIGMVIMQQNVEGFDKYYAELTPASKLLLGKLGFFDIYHVWYFNALLLVLSLNIVLASIDRFPLAWTYISRKKLDASAHWLKGQEQHAAIELEDESRAAVAGKTAAAFKSVSLKPRVTEKNGKTFVFGERGALNRLGAYAVHVSLLTIFLGGFLTAQFGRVGMMPLQPGTSSDEMAETVFNLDQLSKSTTKLPFTVECTDIQQKLIKKEGPISADNTLDWLTYIKIKDPEKGEREALVHLNSPYDYNGYRLFQASFQALGRARNITLRLTPSAGGEPVEVQLKRDGETTLPDGTRLVFEDFFPDFAFNGGRPDTRSGDYNNPAALLSVLTPAGGKERAFAFQTALPEGAPVGAPVAGYKFKLVDFEKVPDAHILSIQKDPGSNVVYLGFLMLGASLAFVFFVSHQRVWALVEERGEGKFGIVLGGNTNRNKLAFEDRFKRLASAISGQPIEVKES